MIIKTISGGHHTATAVITEETKFVFADNWSYFHAKNLSADTAYLSMTSGGSAGDDGVIAVPGGETACIRSVPVNAVYAFAADTAVTVQIDASNTAISPFKSGVGGGESYVLPQATEPALGGIKAKAKTTETRECAIDAATGKMYAPPDNITETLLFDGATNTTDVYTLSAAYTEFNFLIIGAIYSGDSLFNAIINCAEIRATPDYSKKNSLYIGGDRLIAINTNGVNFKMPSVPFLYCKIYGVN